MAETTTDRRLIKQAGHLLRHNFFYDFGDKLGGRRSSHEIHGS